jgi:hypothetical protein
VPWEDRYLGCSALLISFEIDPMVGISTDIGRNLTFYWKGTKKSPKQQRYVISFALDIEGKITRI